MAVLFLGDVVPMGGHVALVDATWQDYPSPRPIDPWVTVDALSLLHPDRSPYPGLTVKTRGAASLFGSPTVRVEVCDKASVAADMTCVFESVLHIGQHGALIGNEDSALMPVAIPPGEFPISVWVNADVPERVTFVVFAIEVA